MILIINNNNNIDKAIMTPKITNYLKSKSIPFIIESSIEKIKDIIKIKKKSIIGIILSGSSYCLSKQIDMSDINKNLVVLLNFPDIPILGICFGFQIMTVAYGGKIKQMEKKELGIRNINVNGNSRLFENLDKNLNVYVSHNDCLEKLPLNFEILIKDKYNVVQCIHNKKILRWGVQFHPEALENTRQILLNFYNICIGTN